MDDTFSGGRFKGRWFSDVAAQESAFCSWAKKQKAPTGSLKAFVAYLRAGHRGQRSLHGFGFSATAVDTPVQGAACQETPSRGSRAPAPPTAREEGEARAQGAPREAPEGRGLDKRFEFALALAVSAPEEFEVGPLDPEAEVPQTIRSALAAHPEGRPCEASCRWRFPAVRYAEVLRWLQWNVVFRCKVEPIPAWVLRRLPAFAAVAEQVQATTALNLSAATKRLLAELPPVLPAAAPTRASSSSSAARRSDRQMDLSGLRGSLLEFQREAVNFGLAAGGRLLLGDEMGLGKTVSALALARQYIEEWPVLVVAPAPLCSVWREHALSWLGLGPADVYVVRSSRDAPPASTRLLIVSYNLIAEPRFQTTPDGTGDYKVVILDECHVLRGGASRRARAAVPLAQRARRALLLSGTPLVATAEDAYPLLDALLPQGELPGAADFAARYREVSAAQPSSAVPASSSSCSRPRAARRAKAVRHGAELHLVLGSVMLRRLKADLLPQLPSKRRQRVILEPQPGHAAASGGISPVFDVASSEGNSFKAESPEQAEMQRACGDLVPAKVNALKDYLHCLLEAGAKFLLFAQHLRVLDELEKLLQAHGTEYMRIDGSTPLPERAEAVARFQSDGDLRVALLSLTACCQGLTLNAASLVVFAELFWVPGVLLQAEDRAHRLGQASSVNVHYLVLRGSVDERMFQAVERRAADNVAVLDGSGAEGQAQKTSDSCLGFQAELSTVASALKELPSSRSVTRPPPCPELPSKRPRTSDVGATAPAGAVAITDAAVAGGACGAGAAAAAGGLGASGGPAAGESDSDSMELVSCSGAGKRLASSWGVETAGRS